MAELGIAVLMLPTLPGLWQLGELIRRLISVASLQSSWSTWRTIKTVSFSATRALQQCLHPLVGSVSGRVVGGSGGGLVVAGDRSSALSQNRSDGRQFSLTIPTSTAVETLQSNEVYLPLPH